MSKVPNESYAQERYTCPGTKVTVDMMPGKFHRMLNCIVRIERCPEADRLALSTALATIEEDQIMNKKEIIVNKIVCPKVEIASEDSEEQTINDETSADETQDKANANVSTDDSMPLEMEIVTDDSNNNTNAEKKSDHEINDDIDSSEKNSVAPTSLASFDEDQIMIENEIMQPKNEIGPVVSAEPIGDILLSEKERQFIDIASEDVKKEIIDKEEQDLPTDSIEFGIHGNENSDFDSSESDQIMGSNEVEDIISLPQKDQ